jgi:hypothetical protein
MEAGSGGQWLLSCPVGLIKADAEILTRLVSDLEGITHGKGFFREDLSPPCDADWCFRYCPPRPDLPADCDAARSLALHEELEIELLLRRQIEDVLFGRAKRLDLPDGFPALAKVPLAQARGHRFGRVLLHSGIRGWLILNTPARDVVIDEPAIEALLQQIETRLAIPAVDHGRWPRPAPARAEFVIQRLPYPQDQAMRAWHRSDLVHSMSKQIIAVLRAQRSTLE